MAGLGGGGGDGDGAWVSEVLKRSLVVLTTLNFSTSGTFSRPETSGEHAILTLVLK